MTTEDLKGTKIYLPYEADRLEFKRKVEKLGIKWDYHDWDDPLFNDIPFIYLDEDLELYVHSEKKITSFCLDRNKQIFLEDVLAIEEPKEECQFKPYDKVLVKDFIDIGKWLPRFFSEYDGRSRCGNYETTDGKSYNFCIPYEGNEELANTTKNPEL